MRLPPIVFLHTLESAYLSLQVRANPLTTSEGGDPGLLQARPSASWMHALQLPGRARFNQAVSFLAAASNRCGRPAVQRSPPPPPSPRCFASQAQIFVVNETTASLQDRSGCSRIIEMSESSSQMSFQSSMELAVGVSGSYAKKFAFRCPPGAGGAQQLDGARYAGAWLPAGGCTSPQLPCVL